MLMMQMENNIRNQEPGARTYTYDNKNQLVKVTKPSLSSGQAGDVIEYTYDGNGNRYSKKITKSDGTVSTRYYSYDVGGNIVSEYEQSSTNTSTRSWNSADSAVNWGFTEGGMPTTDSATKYEGSASIKFRKTNLDWNWNVLENKSMSPINLSGAGNSISFQLYIADADTLGKFNGGDWIWIGNNGPNSKGYRYYSADLKVGWNLITLNYDAPNWVDGTVDDSNITYFSFAVDTASSATTIEDGKILIDDIKYNVSNPTNNLAPQATGTPVVRYVRDNAGQVIEMIQGDKTYYYLYDGQDHITSLTDEQGNVVQTYTYDEYGNITNQTGNIYNPIVYTNYYWDEEVNLYHLKTRYYDPSIGRFLTRDKKGNESQYESGQSSNLYIYAKNDPINRYDPLGKAATIKKKWFKKVVDAREGANLTMNRLQVVGTVVWRGKKIFDTVYDWNQTGSYTYSRSVLHWWAAWEIDEYSAKWSRNGIRQKGKFRSSKNYWEETFKNKLVQTVKFKPDGKITNSSNGSKLDKKSKDYRWVGIERWGEEKVL